MTIENIYVLRTNVSRWREPYAEFMDDNFRKQGFHTVSLPWHRFEVLPHDRDHFTWHGFTVFAKSIARTMQHKLPAHSNLHIIADSTVDYWNVVADKGRRTNRASNYLKKELRAAGIKHATIDAVYGSGFVAMKPQHKDFVTRVKQTADRRRQSLLIIGGWNDHSHTHRAVLSSIKQLSRVVSHRTKKVTKRTCITFRPMSRRRKPSTPAARPKRAAWC